MNEQKMFAVYVGDDFVGIGTIWTRHELAEKLGVKPESIIFMAIPNASERTCHNADKRRMMFACSACGYVVEYDLYAEEFWYCPNCGAKVVDE